MLIMHEDTWSVETKDISPNRILPAGTVLLEQYEILSVLGEGGFAITYMARDKDGKTVAVKEYFPSSFAVRQYERLHVFSKSGDRFEKGKRRFVKEAEVLREFQHLEGIAEVYDCFEENDTAYIVMEYIEGITLKEYVLDQGVLTYEELISLVSPMMRALVKIHRHGVIHRDISPDNIIIGLDNKARLIDFGAAGMFGQGKTVILKTGYAPPEQYIEDGRLGPWTDVYALASTLYMSLTGAPPMDAVMRLQRNKREANEKMYELLIQKTQSDIVPWQADAILKGLSLEVDERYSDMGEFYEALTIEPSIENDVTKMGHMVAKEDAKLVRSHMKKNRADRLTMWLAGISLVLVLILSVIVGILIVNQKKQSLDVTDGRAGEESTESYPEDGAENSAEHAGRNGKNGNSMTRDDGDSREGISEKIATEKQTMTEQNTTVNRQKKTTEKATTETIKIHEDDKVEHLDIEE